MKEMIFKFWKGYYWLIKILMLSTKSQKEFWTDWLHCCLFFWSGFSVLLKWLTLSVYSYLHRCAFGLTVPLGRRYSFFEEELELHMSIWHSPKLTTGPCHRCIFIFSNLRSKRPHFCRSTKRPISFSEFQLNFWNSCSRKGSYKEMPRTKH